MEQWTSLAVPDISMSIFRPSWFSEDTVMVSTAPTCGLTKGGRPLYKVDPESGRRIQVKDHQTGGLVDVIDDALLRDIRCLAEGQDSETLRFVPRGEFQIGCAVPVYYDQRYLSQFLTELENPEFKDFTHASLGELVDNGVIQLSGGHGSPSNDQRVGEVPYIKVSDLRAGFVNINPTNRVPLAVARRFWRGNSSDLRAYDLLCPERTSKNIGDFCVLMPGQEDVVLTKEIIVMRPGDKANFDAFFLLWAMTLKIVRQQWRRIVFMQTNREDVGKRFLEIRIPIAPNEDVGYEVSEPFRHYYRSIATVRTELGEYLGKSRKHHFFVAGASIDAGQAESLMKLR